MPSIEQALSGAARAVPGVRLHGNPALTALLEAGVTARIASVHLRAPARPVRAVLFDKTPGLNWSLDWHQDRTIVVRERRDVPGFGPWTTKRGLQHVAPPMSVLAGMATLRLHLDDVPEDNAPLLIAPGSHRMGRIAEPDVPAVAARCGTYACLATAGDLWAYATPILHASAASVGDCRRRVLQVDYAAADLTGGLEWLGI
nr:phytanoyl-CoA dioxygenase family protein [Sphingomonas guangdongensis]